LRNVVKDAEYQNRIILHNSTLNLPVVARQPHPDKKKIRKAWRRASMSPLIGIELAFQSQELAAP